jgi:hypothetical protein
MTQFWSWLRRLLSPWILTILVVFVSLAAFAYDGQNQARATYDYANKQILRYDTAAMLAANENLNKLAGGRVFFTVFPKFLAAEDGIIYLRTDSQGAEYVGQAINDARYAARQAEHAAANPTEAYTFQELERVPANSGRSLNVAEEDWIRAGGGPQSTGGTLQNARHQMSDFNYRQAGGTISYP